MSAPATVKSNGLTQVGVGALSGVADETHKTGGTSTVIFAVQDFSFEPKRTPKDTMDADDAITMVKYVTPVAIITMKGKVKTLSSSGLIVQEPGTSITTTISGETLALANFAATINGFDPTAGLILLESIKFNQKRIDNAALEADLTLRHLPHAA